MVQTFPSLSVISALSAALLLPAEALALDPGWLDEVQRDVGQREYHVTWQDKISLPDLESGWHAPNRAQGFRTYFAESGIRVVPRTEETPSWEWGLSWVGYGRGGTSWRVPGATLSPEDHRIVYRRGALEESYENSARGLKQGFVLPFPPEELAAGVGFTVTLRARDAAQLVHVDLALMGNLSPVISEDGQSVDFVTATGIRAVHYSELRVTDARGLEVRAWIEGLSNDGLRAITLVLDPSEAVWPLTIDPLATSPAWTAEVDQADAFFAYSVATAGDVNGDGYSDVLVGAFGYDNGQSDEGRVFAYHGAAAGLQTSPVWAAESDQLGAFFGYSVSTAGDVNGDGYADVVVGAHLYDNGQANEGRAFVYHGSPAGLLASPAWTGESNQASADLGYSVAAAGDVNGDGYADAIVAAYRYDNGQTDEGHAFTYHGSIAGLATTPAWTAESDQASASFGISVATAGDVNGDGYADVIAGARDYDNGQTDEGRAFVYHGSAAGLATSFGWTSESDQADAFFGYSVSTAADVNGDGYADVIVGASGYDNGQADEGGAFAYYGSAAGLATSPTWTGESDQGGAGYGTSVAPAGDVNGDGYADVIVGAYLYNNGESHEGRAYAYHGSAAGLATTPAWTAESDQANASFGISVATAGDVNGDGYSDILVGAYAFDNGQTDEGRAYTYQGSATGLISSPAWTAESDQASAFFGVSVSTAGDVNGDGYADVLVGAYGYSNGQTEEGRVFAYHGSAAGLAPSPAWTAEGNQASAIFGFRVSTAGDVNGDGYADVIVGAPHHDNGETDEGRAYAYLGSAAGLAASPAWTAESDQTGAELGTSVATAGDVNGDGYADVLVGAYALDNGQTDEGRTYAYQGSAAGLTPSSAWAAEGDQASAWFGGAVATAGDVNGDGYADILVGAPQHDDGQTDEGRAFVYYGNGGRGLSLRPQQRRSTNAGPIAHLGASDSPDSFRVALLGRTPFGRGRVKLEWEVKPFGSSLNGLGTQTAVHASDSGVSGAPLSQKVSDLIEATPYHWRVRLRYDPATTPFAQRSRWLTVPWNGAQEADLRTAATSAGEVAGLWIQEESGGQIRLVWDASCRSTDTDYAIYEGTLGSFPSHTFRYCTTDGETTRTFTPPVGSAYYLVVPKNGMHEGSYGTDSDGDPRPVGQNVCLPQEAGPCP